jgi:hypothetical protein
MHLIELIEVLERAKVARGNVKLVDVIVMASGDPKPLADYADRTAARSAPAKLAMDVTGMNDDQVEELRAQYPEHELIRRTPEPSTATGEPCNVVDVAKGACTLPIGHEGDHAWENMEGKLTPTAGKVAEQLVGAAGQTSTAPNSHPEDGGPQQIVFENSGDAQKADGAEVVDRKPAAEVKTMQPDLEGKSSEVAMPCPQFDAEKRPCVLPFGHDGDHRFNEPGAKELTGIMEAAAAKLPSE